MEEYAYTYSYLQQDCWKTEAITELAMVEWLEDGTTILQNMMGIVLKKYKPGNVLFMDQYL